MRFVLALLVCAAAEAQTIQPRESEFTLPEFRFQNGATLKDVRMHYTTLGEPVKDGSGMVRNAVLILHGTGGSGSAFLSKNFAGELFGPGQLLDARTHYLILPDNLGHGKSTKPSDGLRAGFPRYGYKDMLLAQHRLLTEGLGVNHLRLIVGTSMGCMHAWMWGGAYPDFMDALMPLACAPYPITGRNYVWRRMVVDMVRNDRANGAANAQLVQRLMTSNTLELQKLGATRESAETFYREVVLDPKRHPPDPDDYVYAVESSWDYDPRPDLPKLKAAVYAVNFADDPVNPPELGIFQNEAAKLPTVKYVVVGATPETHGHGTHSWPVFWNQYLAELLNRSAANQAAGAR
jgi:homoserine O-acetyltransferase/O-succinyltransferase